jgi:hypothetical protein
LPAAKQIDIGEFAARSGADSLNIKMHNGRIIPPWSN